VDSWNTFVIGFIVVIVGFESRNKERGTTIKVITHLVACNINFKPYIMDFV
jgi:hypothetical protein